MDHYPSSETSTPEDAASASIFKKRYNNSIVLIVTKSVSRFAMKVLNTRSTATIH